MSVVADNSRFSVFDLAEAILAQDARRLLPHHAGVARKKKPQRRYWCGHWQICCVSFTTVASW